MEAYCKIFAISGLVVMLSTTALAGVTNLIDLTDSTASLTGTFQLAGNEQ